MRVLACAPSNVAVDNLLEKVSSFEPSKYKPLRLGHPARLLASVLPYSMEHRIEQTDNALLCRDIKKEMGAIVKKQQR